jgi:hypothetical protein
MKCGMRREHRVYRLMALNFMESDYRLWLSIRCYVSPFGTVGVTWVSLPKVLIWIFH